MGNRHVALLIETSREYGRGLLRGIIKYQNEHGFWSVYFKPHGLGDPPPSWLRTWRGDGILAQCQRPAHGQGRAPDRNPHRGFARGRR